MKIKLNYKKGGLIILNFERTNQLSVEYNTANNNEKQKIEEELKKIISTMKADAIDMFKEESNIKKFLDHIVEFNNYSYNNLLLIFAQNPNAEYVASEKTYKQLGIEIQNHDQAINVYCPSFYDWVKIYKEDGTYIAKPSFALNQDEKKKYKDKNNSTVVFDKKMLSRFFLGKIYDIKSTNADISQNLLITDELAEVDEMLPCFIKAIYRDGYKIRAEDFLDNKKGYCDFENKEIVLRKGLSNLMQLKVLVHEYGHALAHKHLKSNYEDYKLHKNKYETEAESISYVVTKFLGLDTSNYSLTYLYSWSKEKDFQEVNDSLSTIVNYSKKIISNYKYFHQKELEKNEDISI